MEDGSEVAGNQFNPVPSEQESQTGVTGEADVTNSEPALCCMYYMYESINHSDIAVYCHSSACMAVAHCSCVGYSEKGAKRAKFYYSNCKAQSTCKSA